MHSVPYYGFKGAKKEEMPSISAAMPILLKKIRENPYVMECSRITGKADYLLRVVARDIPQYREILMGRIVPMKEIASVQTWFVLKTEKRETRLPIYGDLLDAKGEKE